jgi:hypothetical protein
MPYGWATAMAVAVLLAAHSAFGAPTKLVPADSTSAFGASLSVSGNTVVVGAPSDSTLGASAGAAYVYVLSGGVWAKQAKLFASDAAANTAFGNAVAIDGDTALVGSYAQSSNGASAGAAYVFVRSGSTWTQQQKILASDGAAGDDFGFSVALSGQTALIGAFGDSDLGAGSGSAYVFTRSGAVWSLQRKLLAADGHAGDSFGVSVSVSSDTAVVGASNVSDNGAGSGAAYVFLRSGVSWSQQAKLKPSDGAAGDNFGAAVSISADTAAMGAPGRDDNGTDSGAAYVFQRTAGVWSQQAKLLAFDGVASDNFGAAISLDSSGLLVGSPFDDDLGTSSGAVYAFIRSGSLWSLNQKLTGGSAGSQLGSSVGAAGLSWVAGAPADLAGGGSALVFAAPSVAAPALGSFGSLALALVLLVTGAALVTRSRASASFGS